MEMLTLAAPSCPQPQVKAAADSGFYAGPPGGAVAAVPGDIREEINAVLGVTPDCDLEVGAGCTEDDIATAYNSGFYKGPESVPAPALSTAPISRAEINTAMGLAKEAGEGSELAAAASAFAGKLVPQGANLSQIANEPPKLLSKLQTVNSILFHSEGRPPKSAYEVVDAMETLIDAEIAAWREIKAKSGK